MKYEKTSVRQILFAKAGYILMSALFSAAGVFMILKPEISTEIICIAAGILLIIFGIIKIIGYFSKDLYRLAFQYDLAFGILRIILGIIFCTHTAGVVNLFFTAMGILVLVDGLFRIQLAVDAREFGISQWWLLHVLGGDSESVRGTLYDKSGCQFVRKIIARASFYVYNNISISSGKSAACRIASV